MDLRLGSMATDVQVSSNGSNGPCWCEDGGARLRGATDDEARVSKAQGQNKAKYGPVWLRSRTREMNQKAIQEEWTSKSCVTVKRLVWM